MSLSIPDSASRNRSASTGDSGLPQHEHKRPRLSESHPGTPDLVVSAVATTTTATAADTGAATATAQAATAESPDSLHISDTHTIHAKPDLNTPPRSPSQHAVASPTSSKVTINTRPLSSQSSNPVPDESIDHKMNGDSSSGPPTTGEEPQTESHDVSVTQVKPHDVGNPISISSSDSESPRTIQADAPEDYEDDFSDTRLRPADLTTALNHSKLGSAFVQCTFPYAKNFEIGSAHKIVASFGTAFMNGITDDAALFQAVKTWLSEVVMPLPRLERATIDAEQEFWTGLPQIAVKLLRRESALPSSIQVEDLVVFFVGFMRLTKLVADVETSRFLSYTGNFDGKLIRTILTHNYTILCCWSLTTDGMPLYQTLFRTRDEHPSHVVDTIAEGMLAADIVGLIGSISALFEAMAPTFSKKVPLVEPAMSLLQHAGMIIKSCAVSAEVSHDNLTSALMATSMTLWMKINEILDRAIVKQLPWLTIENCDAILNNYDTFVANVTGAFPQRSGEIIAAAGVDPNDFSMAETSTVAPIAWKFTTLRKFIKSGRMELRVSGIGTMADELVKTYHAHIQPSQSDLAHPIVRFMIEFIRRNELVRYLVGVDSHAQIINRSTNVLGFLCVSHSYTDEDTDVIWKTALESQDPRAGAEVLQVLQSNFDNLGFTALCHITTKILELPFSQLSSFILDFTLCLIASTFVKAKNAVTEYDEAARLNLWSLKLCIQLLREANRFQFCSTDVAHRFRQFIPEQIKLRMELALLQTEFSFPKGEVQGIIQTLCSDVRDHTDLACGSAYILAHILRFLDPRNSTDLIREFDIARLIVDDLVYLSKPSNSKNLNRSCWTDYECYFVSLPLLLLQTPDCFDQGLLDEIWLNLLSCEQDSVQVRSLAWSALADVLTMARASNTVLDLVISQFFPRLSADEFNEAILRFAQQAVRYQTRMSPPDLLQPREVVMIPGIQRIWDVMLGAPSDKVQAQASDFIIHEYLDTTIIASAPLSVVEATHVALIERCVQQVMDAANHISASDVDTAGAQSPLNGNSEIGTSEGLRFHRSLFFLRKFLEALKARPRFMDAASIDVSQLLTKFEAKGDTFDLTLQVFNHSRLANKPARWTVGLGNTAGELWQAISDITRWNYFTVIYRGARIDLKDKDTTLSELNFTPGMVMVNKVPGTTESAPDRNARAPSPVDNKVMHHFNDLHKLLDLSNQFAREVYEFLILFSSQDSILNQFRAKNASEEELLPVAKPFKLMYYLRALRSCIEDESFSTQPDTSFLVYAVRMVNATMTRLDTLQADFDLRISIINDLMEALVLAFRAKVAPDISQSYIADHTVFVRHILSLWSETQQAQRRPNGTVPNQTLVRVPFEALLEASLHDEALWSHIQQDKFSDLLLQALLKHPLTEVRQAILDVVYNLTGSGPMKLSAKSNHPRAPRSRFTSEMIDRCLLRLWPIMIGSIPEACTWPRSCSEFFDASNTILKSIGRKLDDVQILPYVEQWKPLLLSHKFDQSVGLPLQDYVIASLGRLLIECLRLHPAVRQQISDSDNFVRDVFSTFLFPPLSDGSEPGTLGEDPILDVQTRQVLYDLILVTSTSQSGLECITTELSNDLVPKDHFFQPQTSHDRQAIRSEVGYAGLKNLSNTCYLNSLFSQLFMNIEFRDLIMGVEIVDEQKQKLVTELSKVFAHMQCSYEEAISPESAVDAITQWDGDQIDVTIQMDVDEFFNLLFDRLEFQILDRDVRNHFKSIYGGQLVQQIKSKECDHVSETLEPFSAVQVEIKGKLGLEESLKAYVEGEVLQGENKYSCTGCGKHVDAVKRACLKDVPDHLIFNLKRFDYDIMTGMRCKVNDEFQFPASIDMSPYTLQALTDPDVAVDADFFELVGVIVHSGTAESGHYYSYIRKRPSTIGTEKPWVQFNDQDVTHFDPATIGDCCFGGTDYGTVQCPKFYSGYMLFYQRKASLESFEEKYTNHDLRNPVRLNVDAEMEQYLCQQNELYLRSFVAQDPIHAKFVKSLLQKLVVSGSESCSADHQLESQLITMVLEYISSTSARWKELPEVEDTLKHMELRALCCDLCAQEVIRWCLEEENFANSVVRCFYQAARRAFARLICVSWQSLSSSNEKQQSALAAGDPEGSLRRYEALLADFVRTVWLSWDYFIRHGRSWDQYFAVLSALTNLGIDEAQIVIDEGFLERALELVHLHVADAASVKRLKSRYAPYLLGKEKNRPYGHSSLIQFVADLLVRVALEAPIDGHKGRSQVGEKFGLLPSEAVLLDIDRPHHMQWLRKIILGGHNPAATDIMVTYIAKYSKLNSELCACLKDGLVQERHIFNAVSFLRPTLTFVSEAVSDEAVTLLVDAALESIGTTNGQYGKDYLLFITALLTTENNEIPFGAGVLRDFLLQNLKYWAPVLLMHPNDIAADVRGETLELLNDLIFVPFDNARVDPSSAEYQALLGHIGSFLEACATYAQKAFLDSRYKDSDTDLQMGQANHVLQVVESYLPRIMSTAEDEEIATRISAVMEELRLKSDGLVDEATSTSEWKGANSDLDALSDGGLSETSA